MRWGCAYTAADHHSTDRVELYFGRSTPALLCGYHASEGWVTTVTAWLTKRRTATPVATPPPIPDDPYAPYDPDAEPVCIHCGVSVVRNYDGPGTGWSHLYPDAREGMAQCFVEAPCNTP